MSAYGHKQTLESVRARRDVSHELLSHKIPYCLCLSGGFGSRIINTYHTFESAPFFLSDQIVSLRKVCLLIDPKEDGHNERDPIGIRRIKTRSRAAQVGEVDSAELWICKNCALEFVETIDTARIHRSASNARIFTNSDD